MSTSSGARGFGKGEARAARSENVSVKANGAQERAEPRGPKGAAAAACAAEGRGASAPLEGGRSPCLEAPSGVA